MAGKKFAKLSQVEEETRRETMQRGIKHGSIQNTIDKTLDKFGDPLTESMANLLRKAHPGADIAKPAVDAFMKGAILTGLAEVLQHANMVTDKLPLAKNIGEDKLKGLAGYLRAYAGSRTGTKTADAAFEMAPYMADMLSNPNLKALLSIGADEKPAVAAEEKASKPSKGKAEAAPAKQAPAALTDDDE